MKLSYTLAAEVTGTLAEQELRRYLALLPGPGGKTTQMSVSLSLLPAEEMQGAFTLAADIDQDCLRVSLTAGEETGLLYAVYELLERLGFGFYPDRDTIPTDLSLDGLNGLRLDEQPAIPLRGMFVIPWFDDLPCYANYWKYDRWQQLVDWMAKQKMNFLRLHIFPTMGFYPLERFAHTRPGENDSDQKRLIMEKVIQRAHQRGIKVSLSFYPNAVTREFSQFYPGTSYNGWYTYYVCLDTDLGQEYSRATVKEMIEAYHPDFIELVTTEVHCPLCGWEKFSKDQVSLFRELLAYVADTGTGTAVFPFVFPLGYAKMMEEMQAPPDTLLFTETSGLSNTEHYRAGGHFIACFEENSTPFMRFKLQEPNEYARQYAQNGTALTYYLTGFTTKNYEICASGAGKQFYDPFHFDKDAYIFRAVRDRFAVMDAEAQNLLTQSLILFEEAWDGLESINLSNGERMFGLMPSVANSNSSMFLETYAPLLLEQKQAIRRVLHTAAEALSLLQRAKVGAPAELASELFQLTLNQTVFYCNYAFLLPAAEAFVLHRKAQKLYKEDLWGHHQESEMLSDQAHGLLEAALPNLQELVHNVRLDPDYHDVPTHVHPYQDKDASVYHNHSGFTLEVMEHRLRSAEALLDEMRALKDKLILERTFQGPHRPFVIPNQHRK